MRFAREVQFQLKAGKEQEFNTLFEKDVLPMLRKQHGFQSELTLVDARGSQSISLWDDRKSAETYQTGEYASVLAKLTTVIEGTPTVKTFESVTSYARA